MASNKTNKGNLSSADFDLVNQRLLMDGDAQMREDLAKKYSGNFQEKSIEEMDEYYELQGIKDVQAAHGIEAAQEYAASLKKVKDSSSGKKYPSSMADFLEGAQLRKHNRDDRKYSRQIANGTPDSQAVNDVDRFARNEQLSNKNEANYYERNEAGAKESDSFMADMGDDADAWLAANGGAVPTSEPKSVMGNNFFDIDQMTETEADMYTQGNASREAHADVGFENQGDTGGTSSMHIQLERFTNMSLPQVKYAYDLLSDPALTGQRSTRSEFNGDVRGVTAKSAVEAAESFNITVHGRGEEFRHELGLFLDRADQGAGENGRTTPVHSSKDQIMMQNMLGVTAMVKEQAGPGTSLYGANMNPESQVRADDDIAWLAGKLDEYAVVYNRDDTRRNAPELYANRLTATKQALSKWLQVDHPWQHMIDSQTGLYMKAEDKNKPESEWDFIHESTAVPLPGELNIRGLKKTANQANGSGSPHTRLSYAALYPTQDSLMVDGKYDMEAFNKSEAGQYSEWDRRALAPSVKRSFFDKNELGQEGVNTAYEAMRDDFKKMAKIMKRETATTQDENWGNGSRSMAMGQSDVEYARQEAINMSKIFDLDQTNEEISVAAANESGFGDMTTANLGTITGQGMTHKSGRTPDEIAAFELYNEQLMAVDRENIMRKADGKELLTRPTNPTDEYSRDADYQLAQNNKLRTELYGTQALGVTGEDKQGMHGAEGSSQSDHFVALMTGGMSADDAYEEVVHGLNKGSYRSKLVDEEAAELEAQGPAPVTDREVYLARQKIRLETGDIHEQRTAGWFEQRKGKITGSGVKRILTKKGQHALAVQMADEAKGLGKKFVSNHYVNEGVKYEEIARKTFEERTGFYSEEAYFETNPDYKGFGVSPDGMVFDKEGNARGVAEFKMHNSVKAMKKGYKDYYNQVQMQMAITDTKEAHFFRINSETDDYMYDVIARDQDHINKMMKGGQAVLKSVDMINHTTTKEEDMANNLSLEEFDALHAGREEFEGYSPTTPESSKAKPHKAYGSKAQQILSTDVPTDPEPAGNMSAHVVAFNRNNRKIESLEVEAFDKQKFDTKMAKELTRMQKEDKTMLEKETANEKKLHDKKMKNEEKFNNLRNKNLGNAVSLFSNVAKQLVAFNRGAGEDAMGIANNAAALGMDSNRAAGQRDLISEAGNMSAADASKLVFAGAQQQNAATAGGGQLRGFMDRQKGAAVTAARGGYEYQVFGPVEMADMNPEEYLGNVMSKIDTMDVKTQAKILGELGLGAASSLIGRTTGEAIKGARHAEYNEGKLRDKDRIIREAATTARDIGFSSLRNTSDVGLRVTEGLAHVLDNPGGIISGVLGMAEEVGMDAITNGQVLGGSPISKINRDVRTNSTFGFASRSGSPFGSLGSATPDDSIQEAMTFRTADEVAPKGKTTVNSNLKVEITENDINTSLTDDFGNTSVSTQPRNGGM